MTVTVQRDNVHLEAQRLLALHPISLTRQVDKIVVLQHSEVDVSAQLKGGATGNEPSLIGEDSSLVANGNTVKPHTCVPTVNRQIETTAKLHEVSNQYANQENLAIYKDCDNLYALLLKAPLLVFAARTPPANSNKYKKRLGAKSSKNLEKLESLGHELNPKEATLYRALSARCNYLAQDRCDISYAAKELCREFAIPNKDSYARLKRLVRYLVGLPRLIYRYDFQEMPSHIIVYSDTDFAGCQSTRRSTSGGVALRGSHNIKHWSKTQTTTCLSSGEAELRGISDGLAQALGLQTIAKDLGFEWPIKMFSDATAAIGIARRRGMGRIRHLDVMDLWVQEKFTTGAASIDKVLGTENPADILTKHVDRQSLVKALRKMGVEAVEGRSAVAPKAMGVQSQLLSRKDIRKACQSQRSEEKKVVN